MTDISIEQKDVLQKVGEEIETVIKNAGKEVFNIHIFEPDIQEELREREGEDQYTAYIQLVHEEPFEQENMHTVNETNFQNADVVFTETQKTHSRKVKTHDTTFQVTL